MMVGTGEDDFERWLKQEGRYKDAVVVVGWVFDAAVEQVVL